MYSVSDKIRLLREALQTQGANALYLTTSDPHLSEYIPAHFEIIEAITGFTGSNATFVLTENDALLWTDSRYWIQAEKELKGSEIKLMKEGDKDTPQVTDWLNERNAKEAITLAVREDCIKACEYIRLKDSVTDIEPLHTKIIETLWPKRPALTFNPLFIHRASSLSAKEKLERLRAHLAASASPDAALLVTRLDDIAWLTNLRGRDIAYNPVFHAWALVSTDNAHLFVNNQALSETIRTHLCEAGWKVFAYEDIYSALEACSLIGSKTKDINARLWLAISEKFVEYDLPIAQLKAQKTLQEIEGLKTVMKADGRAIEAFIAELKARLDTGEKLHEADAATILHKHRARIPGFIDESFETIVAVNANAALAHYTPKGKGDVISPPCVLLVDSGAHYDLGTTDTTRVWFLGNPNDWPKEDLEELKRDYRAVFEANRALKFAVFEKGTRGRDLDSVARDRVKAIGIDYGHGTGHGVGLTLSVHEAPPTITPRETESSMTPMAVGMVVSDEPGIYREDRWGIRLEDLLVCVEREDGKLSFECLTQCAFDEALLI